MFREGILMQQGSPLHNSPKSSRRRILLAEDGEDNRQLVAHYLRSGGAKVVVARDGRVACDLVADAAARGEPFDAVLLDMQMPVLDGYGAATELRERGFGGPIIALTADTSDADRQRSLAAGCTLHLGKPLGRDALLRAIDAQLAARQPATAAAVAVAIASSTPSDVDDNVANLLADFDASVREADATEAAAASASAPPPDDGIKTFLPFFLARLPEYVGEIEECLRRRAIDKLVSAVHQVKGAAGMYGFDRIYDLAATAHRSAKEAVSASGPAAAAIAQLREQVDALLSTIRSVDGYDATKEAVHVLA
jgi:CheY-like chemotaxis protein/HPt (histidine-containing phosphotransfer) domain-containing protein